MSSIDEHGKHFNWIVGPAGACVQFLVEEQKFAALVHRGMIIIESAETLLGGAGVLLRSAGKTDTLRALAQLRADTKPFSEWATEVRASGYSQVHTHGLVASWAAIEASVEDTVHLILTKDPDAVDLVARKTSLRRARKLRFPLRDIDRQWLYQDLSSWSRRRSNDHSRRSVGEGWTRLLGLFEVKLEIPDGHAEDLAEINALRNCILHRNGEIDHRAAQEAPALTHLVGTRVEIGIDNYKRFYEAMSGFALALLNAVLKCKYCRQAPASD